MVCTYASLFLLQEIRGIHVSLWWLSKLSLTSKALCWGQICTQAADSQSLKAYLNFRFATLYKWSNIGQNMLLEIFDLIAIACVFKWDDSLHFFKHLKWLVLRSNVDIKLFLSMRGLDERSLWFDHSLFPLLSQGDCIHLSLHQRITFRHYTIRVLEFTSKESP